MAGPGPQDPQAHQPTPPRYPAQWQTGIGKPEPLRYNLAGHWSRRITEEHRLVYRIDEHGDIHVISCWQHYEEQ